MDLILVVMDLMQIVLAYVTVEFAHLWVQEVLANQRKNKNMLELKLTIADLVLNK